MRKSILIDGYQISYLENGTQGPAIIFIHGNSQSSESFGRQFNGRLGANFRLIAIDLLGHGDSDRPEEHSLPFHAGILKKFVRGLGIEDALFVGHSLGGHILLEALSELPASGAMIFGTPPIANPPAMEMAFLPHPAGALLFQENLTDEETELLVEAFSAKGEGADIIRASMAKADASFRPKIGASVGNLNYKDEIDVIRTSEVPIAVLQGEMDVLINGDYIAALPFENLWKNRIFEFKGVGHFPQLEDAEHFNETLFYFAWDAFELSKEQSAPQAVSRDSQQAQTIQQ